MDVADRLAVVTGASSGIGRATALLLAARGARLALGGTDPDRLAGVAAATGGESLAADLADPDAVAALADRLAAGEPPGLVVHCAGVGMHGAADAADVTAARRLAQVNLLAPMALTGALLPAMRMEAAAGRPGHLVFVTSIAGRVGVPREAGYAATKAALGAYADSVREELVGTGIGVTVVVPGIVDTDFFRRRGVPPERPRPRPVSAERVAEELLRAVDRRRPEVFVPRWLRGPAVLRQAAPGVYARLSALDARRRPR